MNFEQTDGSCKDMKRLRKKYRSLLSDLAELRKILSLGRPAPRKNHTAMLKQANGVSIWKMRLFCEYLKGNSLRVVFAYFEDGSHVNFIELYFKGDKEREDVKKYESLLEQVSLATGCMK